MDRKGERNKGFLVLEGVLPGKRARLVQAWIEIHKDELVADWELASSGKEIFKIDPLR